jgi:hypothetical protein
VFTMFKSRFFSFVNLWLISVKGRTDLQVKYRVVIVCGIESEWFSVKVGTERRHDEA